MAPHVRPAPHRLSAISFSPAIAAAAGRCAKLPEEAIERSRVCVSAGDMIALTTRGTTPSGPDGRRHVRTPRFTSTILQDRRPPASPKPCVTNAIVRPSRDRRHNYVPITHWKERIEGAPFLAARSGGAVQPQPSPAAPTDVRRMTNKEFIEFVGENARRAKAATGVPASVTVAQAIVETGWGKHTIGGAKNLFGIKGRGPAGSVRAPTREYINGKWITVDADFAKYDSFEQSITEHARFFLRNRRYAPALKFKDDPDAFAREIHKAGYATAPNYAEKLIALMRQHNLYRFDR